MKQRIGVIGAGSWGTALAITLSNKGHQVAIWDLNEDLLAELERDRENKRYLEGAKFGDSINVVHTVKDLLYGVDIALFAAPAQHFRSAAKKAKPFLDRDVVVVDVAKGIEQNTLKTMSQISEEILSAHKYAVLSGPSHAEEVGFALPTSVAVASEDLSVAEYIQDVFMTDRFRVYTNSDVVGVELGGALKNIIALGVGISDGMGFGDNAKAAIMTRGMSEISRLGLKLGARAETFSGLSGMGDLIVTCTSMHSRNRRCGIMIGEGLCPEDAMKKVGMVVEGVFTTEAAYELAKKNGVDMPLTESIYKVIKGEVDAKGVVNALMTRQKKHESEYLI